jgi:heme-degrading monooxygenase HmoA
MTMANTVGASYYAVIFTAVRTELEAQEYDDAARRMLELVCQQPGFLGVESARSEDGLGITVSYWADEAAILAWKEHPQHREIRERGRSTWYRRCTTRVSRVEREYSFGC